MKRDFPKEAQGKMNEHFGHDTLISLATVDGNIPSVRAVNSYYEDGSFYVITYGISDKMKQIENNPNVAIAGEWFTAHGTGINLGWICKEENRTMKEKLGKVFESWIDNGHTSFEDENTCLLRIKLTDGILFYHGTRYNIVF